MWQPGAAPGPAATRCSLGARAVSADSAVAWVCAPAWGLPRGSVPEAPLLLPGQGPSETSDVAGAPEHLLMNVFLLVLVKMMWRGQL